ncbi:uncharacterized protein BJ212DRAFT_238308 [Suillus subaureus]|uniref:Uncharacterized protein n=1 Tax=Suillus subaureus TaxID=48587 RepID=A0A9P7EA32_9AGAM|nr:uncharacterized protein BJ212DRAFT_238308 [Suillus subaureus]KAG1815711.1 hypothetical protein BJ212DRAFT_238308 [Suillus subaureus]
MFGSNTVQSSWANPQQNQSQPQSSGFGQPSGFGTGAAFGSTGAFGQPQQPQANPMFGNLANPSSGTSAFGVSYRVCIVFLVTELHSAQAHLARILHNQPRVPQHSELQSLPRAYLEGQVPQLSEVAVILLARRLERGPLFSGLIPTLGVRLVLLDRIDPPLALVLLLQPLAMTPLLLLQQAHRILPTARSVKRIQRQQLLCNIKL